MIVNAYGGTVTVTAAGDAPRSIAGVAATYGVLAETSAGPTLFRPGAFTRSLAERSPKVRLVLEHDRTRPVGRLTDYTDTAEQLRVAFRLASTSAADEAVLEAAEGIRDGLSVGAEVIRHDRGPDGALIVLEAALIEVSLVSFPAFDSARVSDVAAAHHPAGPAGTDPRILRWRLNLKGAPHAVRP